MVRLRIHKPGRYGPGETSQLEVEWPQAPRIGDAVDMEQDTEGDYAENGLKGTVVSVVWWRDGSARVVLR